MVLIIALALASPRACASTLAAVVYVGLAAYVAFGCISTCLLILGLPALLIASAVFFGSAPRGTPWRDRSRRTELVWPLTRWSLMTLGVNLPLYFCGYFVSNYQSILFD